MPEGGAIKGIVSPSNISVKPQGRIEGAESNASGKESSRISVKNQAGANKALPDAQEGAGAKVKGARTGAENNVQSQAKNLNSANNIADTSQGERGQNVNEFV